MIDGNTQLAGVIGHPVGHSLSPAMHNAAFEALGMNWCYVPLPVPPDGLEAAIRGLGPLGFRGVNVTVPHKESVLKFLDEVTPCARALGAVNTIVVERDAGGAISLKGDNTDVEGFAGALWDGGVDVAGCGEVVVVGAGGGARAVVYALLREGVGHITLFNRSLPRAEALARDLGQHFGPHAHITVDYLSDGNLINAAAEAGLLVNTTSVGMWPDPEGSIWPQDRPVPGHLVVFDLVYRPRRTRLLEQAQESGAQAINGMEMLVLQGAASFSLWTGSQPPVDVMRAACEGKLCESGE